MIKPDGTAWLEALQKKAPKLDMDKLDQIAALPLGSRLRVDSWDDKVYSLNAKPVPLLNARDKMPFEVTPVYFKLQRYDQAQAAQATPAAAPAARSKCDPAEPGCAARSPHRRNSSDTFSY